ncbi:MAG: addiction module toxin RelE [Synergistaceae bacterium]
MRVVLKKQPKKYLLSVDKNTQNKLFKMIDDISEFKGNIVKLMGSKSTYRCKIAHYRIVFSLDIEVETITIEEINTRTNITYKRR